MVQGITPNNCISGNKAYRDNREYDSERSRKQPDGGGREGDKGDNC